MSYIGARPGQGQAQEFRFVAVAGQTVFSGIDSRGLTLNYSPHRGSTCVFVNGVLINSFDEFLATDGSTITLASPLSAGDEVTILTLSEFSVANTYTKAETDRRTRKRNRVINGSMLVSQQNYNTASAASAAFSYFAADMFNFAQANVGVVQTQRITLFSPEGSIQRLRATFTGAEAALAAGDYLAWIHVIEGHETADLFWGTGVGKPAILRFGWKSPAGTYSVALRNGASTHSLVIPFTVTPEQANTDILVVLPIPAPAVGAWGLSNDAGINICWSIAHGSTFRTGTVNTWVAGNYAASTADRNSFASGEVFELFDVGFYEGTTLPLYEVPSFEEELRRCQRFYFTTYNHGQVVGAADWNGCVSGVTNTGGSLILNVDMPTQLRGSPTIAWYSVGNGAQGSIYGNGANTPAGGVNSNGRQHFNVAYNGLAAGTGYHAQFVASARL